MSEGPKNKPSGYDKYINYKTFALAAGLFIVLLVLPVPSSMLDVAVEFSVGKSHVRNFYTQELFGKRYNDAEQWEAKTADALEKTMMQGVLSRPLVLKRDAKALDKLGVSMPSEHWDKYKAKLESMDDAKFLSIMQGARELRTEKLTYQTLSPSDKEKADKGAWGIKVCVALVAFVVVCFLTEAIPLPGVAFCIGLVLVFSGMVGREEIAGLFWSDAAWFIMGSLMFSAAFVKTGVDKRICFALFRYLAKPRVAVITGILVLVIAPSAAFISDHALAAMFLPIAIALYSNSLSKDIPIDKELGKMLVICVAMACNIGGFGSPSGGARNVIVMTYLEGMFNINISYGMWMIYAMPFVLIMMPILWLLLNWRFKPLVRDLAPALAVLRADMSRAGPWNRKQIIAVGIFLVMLVSWITESNLILSLTGIRLGIGVLAIAGAVAYLLFGIVNWRDYHEKVDWGVVWLYAGAIVFGKMLDSTGTAYWMARSIVETMATVGVQSGVALLGVGALVTTCITNLMADGPAAAAVGPITLSMASVAQPGTTLLPYMGLITSCSASFAYLLIIGTPPNAIVYASGLLEPKDFLRVGIPCLLISFVVMMALSLLYWPLLPGFLNLRPM